MLKIASGVARILQKKYKTTKYDLAEFNMFAYAC